MNHSQARAVLGLLVLGLLRQLSTGQTLLREPAIPGDHPDPTVIRTGHTYWASSTSGGWAPVFPIFRSEATPDDWRQVGSIFPTPPAWAKGDFWAPELVFDRGHILLYYAARNQDGILCVAVANAATPEGPYSDHGPLVCQPDGSIDPSFIRDRQGKPYLIWKEDGNSRGQPTPIWAQSLSADGLRLEGKPTQILRNDAPWEAGLVEAPYILRHHGWFYLFYAGNTCCDAACRYAEGVARAHSLLGPWEKDPANPIIHEGNGWRCPGHGTVVNSSGLPVRTWILLHAYSGQGGVYVAREAVLARIEWQNGWPVVPGNSLPPANQAPSPFHDSFSKALDPGWQWPISRPPDIRTGRGDLRLATTIAAPTAVLARVIDGPAYTAQIVLKAAPADAAGFAGLGVIGRAGWTIAVGWQQGRVVLWEQTDGPGHVLAQSDSGAALPVELRVDASRPEQPAFSWRKPGGEWHSLPSSLGSNSLLGWDSGLRLGVAVSGPAQSSAAFEDYRPSTR
jgi:xylan 1,4-beta-xylosidase